MQPRHRPESSESVMAEPFVGHRRSPRTFSAGRTCAAPGCGTRLSIYNSGSLCASHAGGRGGRRSRHQVNAPAPDAPDPDARLARAAS